MTLGLLVQLAPVGDGDLKFLIDYYKSGLEHTDTNTSPTISWLDSDEKPLSSVPLKSVDSGASSLNGACESAPAFTVTSGLSPWFDNEIKVSEVFTFRDGLITLKNTYMKQS